MEMNENIRILCFEERIPTCDQILPIFLFTLFYRQFLFHQSFDYSQFSCSHNLQFNVHSSMYSLKVQLSLIKFVLFLIHVRNTLRIVLCTIYEKNLFQNFVNVFLQLYVVLDSSFYFLLRNINSIPFAFIIENILSGIKI